MVPIRPSTNGFCQGERGCENLGDADGLHPSAKLGAINAVAIAHHAAGRRIIGERLDDLSRGPGRGWGICHIEKHDSAAGMQQDDEHVERTEVAVGTTKKSTEARSATWL
jgi:hypothetical protein